MRTAVVTGLVAALSIAGTDTQKPPTEAVTKQIQELNKELPGAREKLTTLLTAPEPPRGSAPLPKPSLNEPFEIGEALYDQGRLASAVVSLLKLMQIGIVPETNASARATGLTLSESEVQALIDLGREDLAAADNEMERIPYSFADLHAGIADLLPGVSVEQLSEAYTKAYQARPDDLIAKALMGQPIQPETKLTRAQIWFLMMDGFAGAVATDGRWGTADREVPDLKSPNAQWNAEEFREVLARLPLVTASRLVTISAPVISQGTTAGPPVNVTARVAASAPPMISRATGRTLLAARAGSLTGQEVTWHIRDDSMLPELGKIVTPVDDPTPVGADGLARFVFQPGADPTRGAGQLLDDWEPIEARFEARGLLASAYTVPAPLASLALGSTRARANVRLRSRSRELLFLIIYNKYTNINFEIPGLGGGTRDGTDSLIGVARKQGDDYWGFGTAEVNSIQILRGGAKCEIDEMTVKQNVRVKVERVTPDTLVTPAGVLTSSRSGLGPTRIPEDYLWADARGNPVGTWASTPPDGGYYRVIIIPYEQPPTDDPCIPNIPAGADRGGIGEWFIPLNDAQWTTSGQGFGIALRAKGATKFYDTSSVDPLGLTPLAGVKALLQLNGMSTWLVVAGRSENEVFGVIK